MTPRNDIGKTKIMKKTIFALLALTISLHAQESKIVLSGNLSQDLLLSSNNYQFDDSTSSIAFKKRSPMLTGGMSLILPGAGQFYNEDYWKTAIFVAVEAAAIVTAVVYNNKGNEQTEYFENFANSADGWNVNQYAQWSVDNATRINPAIEGNEVLNGVVDEDGNLISWSKLNELESAIGHYYSHRLAPFDDQQYYEMIGKYSQFNVGWSDYNDADYPPDGYTYITNVREDPVTATFSWYADERGKANSYYDISNLAVKILVANHIISAVEAALAANSYNRSFNAEVKMQSNSIGYSRVFYPELSMSYRF